MGGQRFFGRNGGLGEVFSEENFSFWGSDGRDKREKNEPN